MGHRPLDALNAQLDLIRWYSTPQALEYLDIWQQSYRRRREMQVSPQDLATGLAGALNHSQTYFVTDEMSAVITAAARSAPTDALHQYDLPAPSGFIWFEQAQATTYEDGQAPLYIRGVHWDQTVVTGRDGNSRPGISIAVYIDQARWLDTFDPPEMAEMVRAITHTVVLFELTGWAFDAAWYERPLAPGEEQLDDQEHLAGACAPSISSFRRLLLSFFRIQSQRIAVTRSEPVNRALRRRADRAGFDSPDPGSVLVVRLRRQYQPSSSDEEHHTVEWSHRWVVDGFWRNQWYPSLGRHQQIYIPSYIKGPTDKPLIVKDKIFSLER